MRKKSSLWDRPRPTLDSSVWDESKKLFPKHKDFILSVLKDAFERLGFEAYNFWVRDVIVTGSIASYQYNNDSDVDVDVIVDLDMVVDKEYGGAIGAGQAKKALESMRKELKGAEVMLPETNHPFEPFFIYSGDPEPKTALPSNVGLYSILEDKWLTDPKEVDLSGSAEKVYPELMEFVFGLAKKYSLSVMDMRQDIVDVEYLRKGISQFPPKYRAIVESEAEAKLEEINEEIDRYFEDTEDLYNERFSGPYPVMPAELQVTYLRRYGYLWLLGQIQELLSGREDLEEGDLSELGEILKEVPRA